MAKRDYGTGSIYIDSKRNAYYGRWRTADGRAPELSWHSYVNVPVGKSWTATLIE